MGGHSRNTVGGSHFYLNCVQPNMAFVYRPRGRDVRGCVVNLLQMWVVSAAMSRLPLQVEDASRPIGNEVGYTLTPPLQGGRVHPHGENRTEQDRTGQYRTGQDRTGQGRAGQDRTGQDRIGQAGQDRTEQNRIEPLLCQNRLQKHTVPVTVRRLDSNKHADAYVHTTWPTYTLHLPLVGREESRFLFTFSGASRRRRLSIYSR